jgi:hypothetical protein
MRYKLAQDDRGLNYYVHDIPEPEGPLLDEIEFAKLCERVIDLFRSDPWIGHRPNRYSGCHSIVLGGGSLHLGSFEQGRYDMLSFREAEMMASIIHRRLDLMLPESWAEVATTRFTASSRQPGTS